MAVAKIVLGLQDKLVLGNIDSKRDWGYAPEYCEGMWRILQHNVADDFVLATGKTHTIREFVELSFAELGITIERQGEGVDEKGVVAKIDYDVIPARFKPESNSSTGSTLNFELLPFDLGTVLVTVSPKYFRPTEVDLLIGNPSKAKEKLGWEAKTDLKELVKIMVESDLQNIFNYDIE